MEQAGSLHLVVVVVRFGASSLAGAGGAAVVTSPVHCQSDAGDVTLISDSER